MPVTRTPSLVKSRAEYPAIRPRPRPKAGPRGCYLRHGEFHAILGGKKESTGKAPSFSNGGSCVCRINSVSSKSSGTPVRLEDIPKANMSRERIGSISSFNKPEQRCGLCLDAFEQDLAVRLQSSFGAAREESTLDGNARVRSRGVDRGTAQRFSTREFFSYRSPIPSSPCAKRKRLPPAACSQRKSGPARHLRIDPGLKVLRCEMGKCRSKLVRSPFGSMMIAGFLQALPRAKPMHRPFCPEPRHAVTTA